MDVYDEDDQRPQGPPVNQGGFQEVQDVEEAPEPVGESEESKIMRYAQHLKSHRRRQRMHKENPDQFIKDVSKLATFKKMTDEEKDSALLLLEHDYDSEEAIDNISESVLGLASGYISNITGVEVDLGARASQKSATIWLLDKVATRMPTATKFIGWASDFLNIYNSTKKKMANIKRDMDNLGDEAFAPPAKRARAREAESEDEEEEHQFRQHDPIQAFGAEEEIL